MSVAVWHDLECGANREDLPVWDSLAAGYGDPILDVGAGTGRVSLELARRGHRVTALDLDPELLATLRERAEGLGVETVPADARSFSLRGRYRLCVVPMQTVQLLGGEDARLAFLRCVCAHLDSGGAVAIAITETVEAYEVEDGELGPLPDVLERDGVVYFSQPTAIRPVPDGFVLERRRERIDPRGGRTVEEDRIRLDSVTVPELEREGRAAGLSPVRRIAIPATDAHVASMVVVLGA